MQYRCCCWCPWKRLRPEPWRTSATAGQTMASHLPYPARPRLDGRSLQAFHCCAPATVIVSVPKSASGYLEVPCCAALWTPAGVSTYLRLREPCKVVCARLKDRLWVFRLSLACQMLIRHLVASLAESIDCCLLVYKSTDAAASEGSNTDRHHDYIEGTGTI